LAERLRLESARRGRASNDRIQGSGARRCGNICDCPGVRFDRPRSRAGDEAHNLSGGGRGRRPGALGCSKPGGPLRQDREAADRRGIEVLRGDSLYEISRRYSVNMRALIETNGLEPPYTLSPGQIVQLPPPNIHVVERGETLYSVSRRYNVDTRSLALMNGLSRPWSVWPGDEILLPALARDAGRVAEYEAYPEIGAGPVSEASTDSSGAPGPISLMPGRQKPATAPLSSAAPRFVDNPAGASPTFIWPVSGPILTAYGAGVDGLRNDGVNIGAETGADVLASAAGDVVYAGDELAGFGNLVLIRHPEGWVSAYAHGETLLVSEGDTVMQGQAIARVGATGSAAQPQVHFELRRGKQPVNPEQHLPVARG